MTSPLKTQCPHCQTAFDVPNSALDNSGAKARCGCCKQTFLVNDHLIVSAAAKTPSKNAAETKVFADNEDDGDLLIHDDMDLEETSTDINDYSSLDDMDAWLNQLENNPADSIASTAPPNQEPSSFSENSASTTSQSAKTNAKLERNNYNDSHAKQSPSAFSDYNANSAASSHNALKSDNEDNVWLEDLLNAQKPSDLPNLARSDTNDPELTQLLSDMGMKADDGERLEQERQAKIAARHQAANQPQPQSIATFLWSLGCLVLALLLVAQYVIFNLDNLIKKPAYAKSLQNLCAVAACSLPHADINGLSTSAPLVRKSQVKSQANFSDIQTNLINQSPNPQLLPNMKVSLYNNGEIIGEFIAQPKDYVLAHESQIAAGRQKPVMFTVPLSATKIQNVTIETFY